MRWVVASILLAGAPALAQQEQDGARPPLEIDLGGLEDEASDTSAPQDAAPPDQPPPASTPADSEPAEALQPLPVEPDTAPSGGETAPAPEQEAAPATTPPVNAAPETVAASTAAVPTCTAPEYSHFDFMIGDWDVTTPDGRHAGTNRIDKTSDGCAIRENWSGETGSTGSSISYYDAKTKMWHQIWVSKDGIINLRGAIYTPGTLMLGGNITYQANGLQREFVGRWTRQEDGSVKQELFEKQPGSVEYRDWFTGIYRKKS